MYISKASLVNYRNFKNSYFIFNEGINTIIGENGSGKSNLFRAIRLLLDDDLLKYSYQLDEGDFNRSIGSWKGHWIIISLEFSDLSDDEAIQSLFIHGLGNGNDQSITKATYNLIFRPKAEIRAQLSELVDGDKDGLQAILDAVSIDKYETLFTGKSTADFNDESIYKRIVGDFVNVKFNFDEEPPNIGLRIPHQLSISHDICFTFIKALRDVVSDFNNNRTNPLITLLRNKSDEIDATEYKPISDKVKELNESIENLSDVQEIRKNIKETIKEAVGETYSPSSLSIKSSLPDEADKLLQSLKLFIGEPDEDHEGGIHELSLGGANLIFLTLKLLEFKYQKLKESFANFLLIEEPEAHIHTHIQKTLFDNLNYGDTQIIYSTHSTFISEVSKISSINILSKMRNMAEVFQPSVGLLPDKITKLQRYLDAVRSNLLFAKGVILVEGDAEQILIPTMIKCVLGISLDELGISLINIGSTGFENVGQLFHDLRLRKKCSIITDFDSSICDTSPLVTDNAAQIKYKKKVLGSDKSGKERKIALDDFTAENMWVEPYYATHTFEVDFIMAGNEWEVTQIISEVYVDESTIELADSEINSGDVAIFGKRVLTMAKGKGKGWFAIALGEYIGPFTIIPSYIIDSIIFAKSFLNPDVISNILHYRVNAHFASNNKLKLGDIKIAIEQYRKGEINIYSMIKEFEKFRANDQIVSFLQKIS